MNGTDLGTDALALWAEVDLDCIRRNVARIKGLIKPGTLLLAVVKANAYGHGEVEAAGAAIDGGADWLWVARVEEGAALRRAGIDRPILLLAQPPVNALPAAAEYNLTPTVYTEEAVRAWAEQAGPGRRLRCHLKVDTGMHRYGVPCADAERFIDLVRSLDGVELEGIWTHFAVAEDVSNSFTSAWAGACLHGLAGDTLAEWMGDRGVVAGDLLKALPLVIHQVSTS